MWGEVGDSQGSKGVVKLCEYHPTLATTTETHALDTNRTVLKGLLAHSLLIQFSSLELRRSEVLLERTCHMGCSTDIELKVRWI